jgi:hypothetical protein
MVDGAGDSRYELKDEDFFGHPEGIHPANKWVQQTQNSPERVTLRSAQEQRQSRRDSNRFHERFWFSAS